MKNKYLICKLKRTETTHWPFTYYSCSVVKKWNDRDATLFYNFVRAEFINLIKNKTLFLTRRFDNPIFEWDSCLLLWNDGERYK